MSLLQQASLIVTPNGYKEGKLYSVIPPDGSGDLSVTRATTATRVNSQGLVELVPYNLFSYSEQFDNAYWTKVAVTISSNATTAPNGKLTADKAVATATTTTHDITKNISRPSGSYTSTISIYAKKSEDKYILLQLADASGGIGITFDVDLGTVSTNAATYGTGWSLVSNSITSVGDGWFRITLTATTINASTSLSSSYRVGNIANLFGGSTGNGIDGLFVWGGQLVEGTQVKEYYPTETRLNIPRLDYSLGSCPSILVEPQRTNLVTWSEDYSSTWGSNFASITKNLISPSGLTNASTIVNSTGPSKSIFKAISVVSGNTYTFSVYVKKISGAFTTSTGFRLTSWGSAVASQTYTDLGTTLTTDWIRYSHSFTATSTATVYVQIISNEVHTFGLGGAQLEAGAYATSYIPSTSASVTRNLDSISKTGISSLLNPSQGTLFVEASTLQGTEEKAIQLSNGSDLNVVMLHYYGGNEVRCTVVGGGSTYLRIVSINVNNVKKMAVSWKSTGVFLYINGVEYSVPLTAGSGGGVPSTLDRLTFSYWWGGFPFLTNTKLVAVWKTQLTSAQCIALTTL